MDGFNASQFSSTASQLGGGVSSLVSVLEVLGYILIVVFLATIIYCFIVMVGLKTKTEEEFNNHFVRRDTQVALNSRKDRWGKVTEAITSANDQLWRAGIIEADTMLEEVVDDMGLFGDTFGEKLKQINRSQVSWIDAAWEVHRLRNVLAHEGGRYRLNQREAYRAYKIYESILYETGYLS